MFQYYNANPLKRHVNDCTVRAISLALGESWDSAYEQLGQFARARGLMPDDIMCIDEFLETQFANRCRCKHNQHITVKDFVKKHPNGTYLITMSGHITCAINGKIYDTFDPSDRYVWGAYKIEGDN